MMSYSTDASSSDSQGNFSSLAYDVVFVVGFVLLILLIFVTCWLRFRAERRSQSRHPEHGVNLATLSSFPKLSYSEAKLWRGGEQVTDPGCSICLADYKESDLLRSLPHCGHMFHVKCVDPWLRMHSTCPICRTSPITRIGIPIPEPGQPPS